MCTRRMHYLFSNDLPGLETYNVFKTADLMRGLLNLFGDVSNMFISLFYNFSLIFHSSH